MSTSLVGRQLGQYQVVGSIGRGGMADVYRGVQASIGREVAIKVLPSHFLQDGKFLERFNREVKIIASLQHPHILPVYDFGEQDGLPYIVMAYLRGGTLADRIAKSGGLGLDETVRIVDQISSALDFAHEKAIIHRDFKPSNVLLDEKSNVYLSDFGIAKVTAETAQLTGSGLIGTPDYMAPEMGRLGGLTPLIDVYALGVTVFQMLTGEHPYAADTPMGVIMAHATQPVPDVRVGRPDLPPEIQAVIEWGMAKDPAGRAQSAGELARNLKAAAAGETLSIRRTPAPDLTEQVPQVASMIPRPAVERAVATSQTFDPAARKPARVSARKQARGAGGKPARRWGIVIGSAVVVLAVLCGVAALTSGQLAALLPLPLAAFGPTPTPSVTPGDQARALALAGLADNAAWKPYVEEFNSVRMALVPKGCFQMGSTMGKANEAPVAQQCFSKPFWIDATEVTNGQFDRLGGTAVSSSNWIRVDYPRQNVTWAEANAFCQKRGARLPTEVEWEYAARGPDDLNYPWGNVFNADALTFANNSRELEATGNRPAGASWVGALDMSGNISELTHSWYVAYPYNVLDGREDETNRWEYESHVLRGGSFFDADPESLRASYREGNKPSVTSVYVGFRCARDE